MSIKMKIKNFFAPVNIVNCTIETTSKNECLKNSLVVVTGGGSGIGKAIARKVVESGGQVILIGRREEVLKSVAQEIGISDCKYHVYDISNASGTEQFFIDLEKKFNKKITALVNNAGIYIDRKPTEFSTVDFDKVMDVNLKAPMFLSIAFVNYCRTQSVEGNIVMTASNRGLFGDYGPYGVSKKGIIHYVEGLARELIGTGIRVNAVAPGMTASEINGVDITGNLYTPSAKGKRVLLAEEIAEVVCFLLSGYSKCINGVTIPCDEGDFLR